MYIPEWQKYFCMQKISILSSKLSVLEPFLIVSSFGLFHEVSILSTFSKLFIWINGHSRMEKISLHAKNQHPTFKFIHFRTVFHIPQRRDFDLKMRKLQTSIKSIILGLGIKQNLFWNHQSINFMKITTRNTGTKLC